ncbi:MAG: histidinol-phosphate transaminase [Armatimonadetes bacterium]|nr:histidinol-phosphate transaminase [Armatimonadota bacterium]MDE2205169.1 histidinol-phosphate transaminase [Armatimonadota bacterium]
MVTDANRKTNEATAAAEASAVAERIQSLAMYKPGKSVEQAQRELGLGSFIKLASNENVLGPSPLAVDAIRRSTAEMHLYPDPDAFNLSSALSRRLELPREAILPGNGSDELIHLLGVTLLEPGDEVIAGTPSFARYQAAAVLNRAAFHAVDLLPDGRYDVPAMARRVTARTRLVFIANPNNPTGRHIDSDEMEQLLAVMPPRALLILDEAYGEYAAEAPGFPDSRAWIRRGAGVVALRTFSKAYGLAGLRVGYALGPPTVLSWLRRVREPFSVSLPAQSGAIAALEDVEHLRRTLEMNRRGKQIVVQLLAALGLECPPSSANFVWFDCGESADEVARRLLQRGVIVRSGAHFGAPQHLRVTIGEESHMQVFGAALAAALAAGRGAGAL